MTYKLSVIIPCFNSAQTLEEAVVSCFTQGFSEAEFQIVLVDDKSSDTTPQILKTLQKQYSNIVLRAHETNRGGGATRNTGAAAAESEVLFFLDSDDILPPRTLDRMYQHLISRKCDGVGIHKSIKFRGINTNDVACIHTFIKTGERITLEDLLQKDGLCSLYSTFMCTKDAFTKAGGYPTHHGFDTQGFAWRFMAAGLHAETCKDATYLHRVHFHQSYYLREYEHGRTNFNWLEIFKEHFELFTDEAQRHIQTFEYQDFTQDLFASLIQKDKIFLPSGLRNKGWNNQDIPLPVHRNSPRGLYFRVRNRARRLLRAHPYIRNITVESILTYEDIMSRLSDRRRFKLLYAYVVLRIKKLTGVGFQNKCSTAPPQTVDVVVPTLGKDFSVFDTYIQHLKKNVCERIGSIYVVAPAHETDIKNYCEQHNLIFIDESSVLGYTKTNIDYTHNGINRSGWLFQQLLKLSGDTIVKNEAYIIVDSDTLLVQPHNFYTDGRYTFFESREWHKPYFDAFKALFEYSAPHPLSLTSHMMIFNTKRLIEMKREIELRHNMPWDQAYIAHCIKTVSSGISDYDTYAQWMIYNHSEEVTCLPFYNVAINRATFLEQKERYFVVEKTTRSISLHSYN